MHLTRHTDYAFRTLIFLGLKPREDLSRIKEIADAYDISDNHLMKVVQRLGQVGFVETLRGRQGGLRLAKDPTEIGLGEVVRACEDDLRLVECRRSGKGACTISPCCALPPILDEALSAFLTVLDKYTLDDLLKSRRRLHRFLIEVPEPEFEVVGDQNG